MLNRLLSFHFGAAVTGALLASVSAVAVAAPRVETKPSSPVTNVTREQLQSLPISRSVQDLLKSCPAQTIPTATSQPAGGLTTPPASQISCVQPADLRMIDIYKAHTAERAAVGAQPLRWNPALEATATARAHQLAQSRQLIHAPREGRGIERENLMGVPIGWSPNQMMDRWVGEKRYFHPGIYPNVCTGDWSQCAHYTQMIWPTTTDIGCGMAPGGGFNWMVCRYSPGGNKDGKPVIQQAQVATTSGDTKIEQPKLPATEIFSKPASPAVTLTQQDALRTPKQQLDDVWNHVRTHENTVDSLEKDAHRARTIANAAKEAGEFSDVDPGHADAVAAFIEGYLAQMKAKQRPAAVTADAETKVEQPQLPSQETNKPAEPKPGDFDPL